MLQSYRKCTSSHSVQFHDSNHTHSLTSLQWSQLSVDDHPSLNRLGESLQVNDNHKFSISMFKYSILWLCLRAPALVLVLQETALGQHKSVCCVLCREVAPTSEVQIVLKLWGNRLFEILNSILYYVSILEGPLSEEHQPTIIMDLNVM